MREKDRERETERERERGSWIAEGVAGDQDSEGVARAGPKAGWQRQGGEGSYKIQFQGCRFNTTHTAQIFHLLSTFRSRYVGIRRAARVTGVRGVNGRGCAYISRGLAANILSSSALSRSHAHSHARCSDYYAHIHTHRSIPFVRACVCA